MSKRNRIIQFFDFALVAAITLSFWSIGKVLFLRNIHWDEFVFLARVYQYQAHTLVQPLQSFYVHFFGWLTDISGTELRQVLIGRLVSLVCLALSSFFTFRMSRLFVNQSGALFSVLCYLSLFEVIEHGAAFRVEPFTVLLFLIALDGVLRSVLSGHERWLVSLAGGFVMAVAVLFTIKAALYVFFLVAIFATGILLRRVSAKPLALFLLSLTATCLLLYSLHRRSILHASAFNAGNSVGNWIQQLVPEMIQLGGEQTAWKVSIGQNPWQWALLVVGVLILVRRALRSSFQREEAVYLLSFCFFLLPLCFYRNSFSYYYLFVFSPLVVVSGVVADKMIRDFRTTGFVLPLVLLAIATVGVYWSMNQHLAWRNFDGLDSQREVVDAVHRMFPQPVPYFDRCSMIASFPKIGPFMSSLVMTRYRIANQPVFEELIRKDHPLFILMNSPYLDLFQAPTATKLRLLSQDEEILRENYIPHWGIIAVAGKEFRKEQVGRRNNFEILIPGRYTFESAGDGVLDDKFIHPGKVVFINTGTHHLFLSAPAKLRWGDHLYKPALTPSEQPVFHDY